MEEIARLARADIYAMKPYSSGRVESGTDAEVYMDANENPYPPFPGGSDQAGLNRYPEPQPRNLIARFAELFDVPVTRLFLSRGADEAIDLLVRAFCAAGSDGILVTPPSFVMYETSAAIQGAAVHRVPLIQGRTFELDADGVLATCHTNPTTKLVFVCSPNNPTGNLMNRNDVVRLATELLGRALVVVDQTYVDYSGEEPFTSEIDRHPNLVVLRTVSKEYSLAGERCGVTVAQEEVIGILLRVMAPYSIPASTIRHVAAGITPDGIEHARANIRLLLAERARLEKALSLSPVVRYIFPSDANFLLVQTADASGLTRFVREQGVVIRNRSSVVEGSVRISVGTPEENDRLLNLVESYAAQAASPAL